MPRELQKKNSSTQVMKNATNKPATRNFTRQKCRRGKGGAIPKSVKQPVAVADTNVPVNDARTSSGERISVLHVNTRAFECDSDDKAPLSPFVFPGLDSFKSPATSMAELPPPVDASERPSVPSALAHIPPKTFPCKHFVRTRGSCPFGEKCHFLHDHSILSEPLETTHVEAVSRSHSPADSSISTSSRWSGSTVQDASSSPTLSVCSSDDVSAKLKPTVSASHRFYCWSYVQGLCNVPNCEYLHPRNIIPYIPMTPCLTYPTCHGGEHCPFKHPESSVNFFAQAPEKSLNSDLPLGSRDVNGTVFFPVPLSSPALPSLVVPNTRYALVTPQGYEFVVPPTTSPLPWASVPPTAGAFLHGAVTPTQSHFTSFMPTQTGFPIPPFPTSRMQSAFQPCALDALTVFPSNPSAVNMGFQQPEKNEGSVASLVQNSILREGSQICF